MISVELSDVGLRRTDIEAVDGVEHFAIVADVGVRGAFVRVHTAWRSPSDLLDFATRITDAVIWLQEN